MIKNSKIIKTGSLYPKILADVFSPTNHSDVNNYLSKIESTIPRGYGKAYGDCNLNNNVIDYTSIDDIVEFNEKNGIYYWS